MCQGKKNSRVIWGRVCIVFTCILHLWFLTLCVICVSFIIRFVTKISMKLCSFLWQSLYFFEMGGGEFTLTDTHTHTLTAKNNVCVRLYVLYIYVLLFIQLNKDVSLENYVSNINNFCIYFKVAYPCCIIKYKLMLQSTQHCFQEE